MWGMLEVVVAVSITPQEMTARCTPLRLQVQMAALQVGVECKGSSGGLSAKLLLQAGFTPALKQAAQGCLLGTCAP